MGHSADRRGNETTMKRPAISGGLEGGLIRETGVLVDPSLDPFYAQIGVDPLARMRGSNKARLALDPTPGTPCMSDLRAPRPFDGTRRGPRWPASAHLRQSRVHARRVASARTKEKVARRLPWTVGY